MRSFRCEVSFVSMGLRLVKLIQQRQGLEEADLLLLRRSIRQLQLAGDRPVQNLQDANLDVGDQSCLVRLAVGRPAATLGHRLDVLALRPRRRVPRSALEAARLQLALPQRSFPRQLRQHVEPCAAKRQLPSSAIQQQPTSLQPLLS